MPLKSGKKSIGKNIKELMGKFKRTGKIGTSKPKSEKAAQKQAVAIAYQKANESVNKEKHEFVVSCDRKRLTTQAASKEEAIRNVCWRMANGNKTRFQELKKHAKVIKEAKITFDELVESILL